MGMTAAELIQRMSLEEFCERYTLYLHDPWDEQRADLRAGIIASTVFNMWKGKDEPARTPQDFMPGKRRERTAEEELEAVISYEQNMKRRQ